MDDHAHNPSTENERLAGRLADYRWLFDTADVATIIIDRDGTYLDVNLAYCRLMGYEEKQELRRSHPVDVSPPRQPDGRDSFEKANEMIEQAYAKGVHRFEWMHRRPDGHQFLSHVQLDLIEFSGRCCVRAVIHDITERRKLERLVEERTVALEIRNKELEHLSSVDPLTRLYNRRKYEAILSYVWEASARSKEVMGVLFLDVDGFKAYNDHYGHAAGDDCLTRIAAIIKRVVRRRTDFVARYGGEEFVVVVPDTRIAYVEAFAEGIINAVGEANIPHDHSDVAAHVTVSIGCAVVIPNQGCATPDELLEAADRMLYRAKANGRNRYEVVNLEKDRAER